MTGKRRLTLERDEPGKKKKRSRVQPKQKAGPTASTSNTSTGKRAQTKKRTTKSTRSSKGRVGSSGGGQMKTVWPFQWTVTRHDISPRDTRPWPVEELEDYVTGVDVGTVNLAFLAMGLDSCRVLAMGLINLRTWQDPSRSKELTVDEMVQSLEEVMDRNKATKPFVPQGPGRAPYKSSSMMIVERQPPGGPGERRPWVNMMVQTIILAKAGSDCCTIIGSAEGKKMYPDSFPVLPCKVSTMSQRNAFNKKNAERLKKHVLDDVEMQMIEKFPKGRHHHLVDAWLMARYAVKKHQEHEEEVESGMTVYI